MKEIVINVDEERDAYVVSDPDNLIYLKEYEQIKELLRESINSAKKYVNRKEDDGNNFRLVHKHDTIMLAGVRGSGKTSFMLSILEFIKINKIGINLDDKQNAESEIESLHLLDPTLIEDKTHIFINIISMIKSKVDGKAKKTNCFNEKESELSRKYTVWEKSFRELAEGLPSIDGIGADGFTTDTWLDAEFVMDKGVRMAHAANNLEKAFHDFVRLSLDFIDKKAFILCVDDIDTNFGKGWPVLEVLHKYLTTPQIITILSGDPSLYSILIRQQLWDNFSNRLLNMEAKTSSEDRQKYKETVTHLEEQYFLKLLKPERRIFLNSLYRMGQQESENIIIVLGKERLALRQCYKDLLKSYGIHSGGQQESFYRFIASTPLRTQKQLLYAFDNSKSEYGQELGNSIVNIFWSDLTEKNVDVSNLRNVPHYAVPQIIDYLVGNKILIEGYTLTPLFSDHFINGSQFALGTIITDRIKKDPTQIFEYWLRICLTRELGSIMEGHIAEKGNGPSVEDYVDYCAVNKLRTSRYVSRFSTAYIRAYLGYQSSQKSSDTKLSYNKSPWHGTLPLLGLATKAKKNLPDRIDSVLDQSDYFTKVMGYLPLSGSTNHKGESLPVYSFYNLLGVLGEIVLVARSAKEGEAVTEVRRTIIKNSQYREYPLPAWAMALSPGEDSIAENDTDDGEKYIGTEEIESIQQQFVEEIVKWATCPGEPELVVSPSMLGKIFTRFFYTTNNMDKELAKEKSLGNWMHRMVVAFLHSVVLVEAMERLNHTNTRLDLKNPVEKDTIFINNLAQVNASGSKDLLKFSRWLLACPVWKVYMKKRFDSKSTINAEGEFLSFVNPTDKPTQTDGGILHVYDLNSQLCKISVNIYESMTSNIKLPNFSVNLEKCKDDFIRICKSANFGKGDIISMGTDQFLIFMKKNLSDEYNKGSISSRTATSIKTRLTKDEWEL